MTRLPGPRALRTPSAGGYSTSAGLPKRIAALSLPAALALSSALGALALLASPVVGQSFLGIRGLGFPSEPLDARARALGSVGVGLRGVSLVPTDPAAAARLLLPALELTFQPQWGEGSLGDGDVSSQGNRFPLIALGYPIPQVAGVVTLTLGSFMDQRWELRTKGVADLEGTPTPITDEFRSDGGVGVVRLGWAQRVGERVALAAGVGTYTGTVSRVFTRTFDSLSAGGQIPQYEEGGQWGYGGATAQLGALWDAAEFLRFSGALTWSSDLDADPSRGTDAEGTAFDLPLEVRLGATGVLTPQLDLTLGLTYADWKSSEGGLEEETVVGGVWSMGGGVEWRGLSRGFRALPVRLGARWSDLPFRFGEKAPRETLYSAGVGLELLRAEDVVLGALDLALERGNREAGDLSERFWRGTLTIRVAGF